MRFYKLVVDNSFDVPVAHRTFFVAANNPWQAKMILWEEGHDPRDCSHWHMSDDAMERLGATLH